jgi:hypothetical protein
MRPVPTAWILALVCGSLFAGETPAWGAGKKKHAVAAKAHSTPTDPASAAADVDRLLFAELTKAGVAPAERCNDEDFLRRVSLDVVGKLPSPEKVSLFCLNPDPHKREKLIDQLLASDDYGRNWGRYWRDVVFMNATNNRARFGEATFEQWISRQLNANVSWDRIVTEMLTATGDVRENGATALFLAHEAQPPEVAAEASRIFLGIQVQCANCHDHPSDIWKREQFHQLAAYFPRVAIRPKNDDNGGMRSFEIVSVNSARGQQRGNMLRDNPERFIQLADRNQDGKVTKEEIEKSPRGKQMGRFLDRIFDLADANKDGALTAKELKDVPPMPERPGRGSTEYYMPDLNDPSSKGKLIQPKFFVDESSPGESLSDEERRAAVAKAFTSPDNPWFSRALVNRLWSELLGEGFYMPVDDIGPTRTARFPEALDVLAQGFAAQRYDVRWLMKTILLTDAYQRQIRPKAVSEETLPFAAQTPTRLRSDQLFNALVQVLGLSDPTENGDDTAMMAGPMARLRNPRNQFHALFSFDPSTPQEDITGNVPQSLFLMNSPLFRSAIAARGNTRLARILRNQQDDGDALNEVYLLVLAREPSDRERQAALDYVRDVGARDEAFEDLMWCLLNSSEFLSKR